MSFKQNILNIQKELLNYHRDRDKLFYFYVNDRLNKSIKTYYKELSNSVSYLENRKKINKILKNINKD